MFSRRNRKPRRRSAAVVVEAAIVLPVIFFIILGTTEICNRIFLNQSLKIMAYEGARISVVPNSTIEDIRVQVEDIALARGVENVTVVVEPENYSAQPLGTFIEVSVTASGPQPRGLNLFRSPESTTSVAMMKEFN